MIAIDTSAFARYLAGNQDRFYFVLTDALKRGDASLPPGVITELLSNQSLTAQAHLADCLIAQSCIDNDAPLITYDRDFRHFEAAGLRVI